MKKIKILLLALGIITCTAITVSCNDDDDYYTPGSSIVEIFDDYYPDATDVRWYYVGGYYVADFDYYGDDMEAWFSNDGSWLYTKTEIVYATLPVEVQVNLMTAYIDYDIEDIIKITTSKYGTFYNIEIENDNEELSLLYDESGTLIKIYANVMPYSWWDNLN